MRRVVVTGLGAITPLGVSFRESWKRLVASEIGVKKVQFGGIDDDGKSCVDALAGAPVPDGWSMKSYKTHHAGTTFANLPRFVQFALLAADDAVEASGLRLNGENENAGVSIGVGLGSLDNIVMAAQKFPRVSPFFIPQILPNMASGHVSLKHGLKGPNMSAATACAAGAHAIGEAWRVIQRGDADIMLAGGSEACLGPIAVAGFRRMRALSTSFMDDPTKSSRPFDSRRDGFVVGEGASVLVLESLEHALQRSPQPDILAEVTGFGMSGDSSHITTPPASGAGAVSCMQRALRSANMEPQQINYVNAHATSTPVGDAAENAAIKTVFKKHAYSDNFSVSSCKGSIGHLLGAAGAIEAAFTIQALNEGLLPPTMNVEDLEPEFDLDYVSNTAKRTPIEVALSNSFGFGGTNASLIFNKYHS